MIKPTISARIGYKVRRVKNLETGETKFGVYDGDHLIMVADQMSVEAFDDAQENNEAFNLCEVFTTIAGNIFAYWRDEELDEDYITKIGS
jgi:hypothetical protein